MLSDLLLFSVSICCCCFLLLMQLNTLALKVFQLFCGHDPFPSTEGLYCEILICRKCRVSLTEINKNKETTKKL